MNPRLTIHQINASSQDEFVRVLGGIFEHSPWIAEKTWPHRPFANLDGLHSALCGTVRDASAGQKLALIRAHPDLVGRAALAGTLTRESTGEQASAGLNNLSAAEVALFQNNNHAYQEKFGFPFVICARLNKKDAILAGFERRLKNSPQEEMTTALAQIFQIARLRLEDIVTA
jgi:2-oxo-4-hydroxy-4-carboxy-5-ureidoimidazoline decarboxylase